MDLTKQTSLSSEHTNLYASYQSFSNFKILCKTDQQKHFCTEAYIIYLKHVIHSISKHYRKTKDAVLDDQAEETSQPEWHTDQ